MLFTVLPLPEPATIVLMSSAYSALFAAPRLKFAKFAAPDVVEFAGAKPYANTPPVWLNVVATAVVPGCVGGVALMWFVPASVPGWLPTVVLAVCAAGTVNPAGPVIVGVLYSVPDRPLAWRYVVSGLR